jgi:non-specific serine/threonine protein kinase
VKRETQIIFAPFRLDTANQQLFRGGRRVALRPKSFAVLQYLAERPSQAVTREELLDTIWADVNVSDTSLKVCVREIRSALGDDATKPRFIETMPRSGYRFIATTAADNLPLQLTSFIGREREIAEIEERMKQARLLTLTGAAGSGKTRLAIHVAARLADDYTDGVCWVELAALSDPALMPQTIAAMLGVREQPNRALTETLRDYLRPRQILLILDNCEHLVAACATLADALLRACPGLKMLATSRQSLGVNGEAIWPVPPLSIPNAIGSSPAEELIRFEAARLFIERASAVRPRFALTEQNAPVVAQICRRLDGIPLAIELAAARLKALSVEEIAARLVDCFRLLTVGGRAEMPRHQTLRAAVDWSHDLLTEPERALMRRLSVFAGDFTLEAAEAVFGCGLQGEGGEDALDLLSSLVDKSLVVVAAERAGESRYRLLETMRQYGRERLSESGETAEVQLRHLSFFLKLAEMIEPEINMGERDPWLARLESEQGNLRAALRYAVELGEMESKMRLAGSLFWFWFHRGYWSEGREWLKAPRLSEAHGVSKRARAKALFGEGTLAWAQGDAGAAGSQLVESVAVWRELDDPLGLAYALQFLGMSVIGQGDVMQAHALEEESVAIFRTGADQFGLATSLSSLGVALLVQGEYVAARSYFDESVIVFRAIGDEWGVALPLRNLGIAALRQGDYKQAAEFARESLRALRGPQEKWFISRSLETLAEALAMQGDCARAARLFGASEAMREEIGASVLAFYRADYDSGVAATRAGLSEEALWKSWDAGRVMTPAEAVVYALTDTGLELS